MRALEPKISHSVTIQIEVTLLEAIRVLARQKNVTLREAFEYALELLIAKEYAELKEEKNASYRQS